jgi:hypothetical protein
MRQVFLAGKVTLIALCLVTCGCIVIFRGPGRCILSWDAVTAERRLNQIPEYTSVRINLEKLKHGLTVRMPDGKLLRTTEITPEIIWPYTLFGHIGNPFPTKNIHGQARLDVMFDCSFWTSGGSYLFEFQEGRLVAMAAGGDCPACPESCRPGIGNAEGTMMYMMPLTEEQLTGLFGPLLRRENVRGEGLIPP